MALEICFESGSNITGGTSAASCSTPRIAASVASLAPKRGVPPLARETGGALVGQASPLARGSLRALPPLAQEATRPRPRLRSERLRSWRRLLRRPRLRFLRRRRRSLWLLLLLLLELGAASVGAKLADRSSRKIPPPARAARESSPAGAMEGALLSFATDFLAAMASRIRAGMPDIQETQPRAQKSPLAEKISARKWQINPCCLHPVPTCHAYLLCPCTCTHMHLSLSKLRIFKSCTH